MNHPRGGHTLIELIVTIAIILILAALIFAAIVKLRQVVMSLTKQVGGGHAMVLPMHQHLVA